MIYDPSTNNKSVIFIKLLIFTKMSLYLYNNSRSMVWSTWQQFKGQSEIIASLVDQNHSLGKQLIYNRKKE